MRNDWHCRSFNGPRIIRMMHHHQRMMKIVRRTPMTFHRGIKIFSKSTKEHFSNWFWSVRPSFVVLHVCWPLSNDVRCSRLRITWISKVFSMSPAKQWPTWLKARHPKRFVEHLTSRTISPHKRFRLNEALHWMMTRLALFSRLGGTNQKGERMVWREIDTWPFARQ